MKKRDIIELTVTTVLILLLISLVFNGVRRVRRIKLPKPKASAVQLKKKPLPLKKEVSAEKYNQKDKALFRKLEEESSGLQLVRDPFNPGMIMPPEMFSSGLNLSGIFWDEKSPSAIINGIIVGIGDEVGNNKVIGITPNSVILNDGISDFSLRFEQ